MKNLVEIFSKKYNLQKLYNFLYTNSSCQKSFEHIKKEKSKRKSPVFQGVINSLNRVLNSFEQNMNYTNSIICLRDFSQIIPKIPFCHF